MANKAFGVGAKLTVDGESEFKEALAQINRNMQLVEAQAKLTKSAYDENTSSITKLKDTEQVLNEKMTIQQAKVEELRKAYESCKEQLGENNEKTQKYELQLIKAETQLNNLTSAHDDAQHAVKSYSFLLEGSKETLEKYKEKITTVKEEHPLLTKAIETTSESLKNAKEAAKEYAEKGLKVIAAAGAATVAGLTAVAGAVGKITASAVESYADYEQLVGGVETLFGESASTIQQYADTAFKTAGMSANEYMETVTGFSASLISSLDGDTKTAAEKANQAIIDMSDNANKMGSDLESIQNAYSGFSKGQFNMLDNLKLGYGGTKTEMERLLADATKLSGVTYDIDSYADIVDAIHVVQQEMGITGTTAKEASKTVSGSLAATKTAYQNLITGLANDNSDLVGLVDGLFSSIGDVIANIVPVVQTVLEQLPGVISDVSLMIVDTIETNLPSFVEKVPRLLSSIVSAISENLPMILNAGAEILLSLVEGFAEQADSLADSAVWMIKLLIQDLTEDDKIEKLVKAAIEITKAIVGGLIDAAPLLIEGAVSLVSELVVALTKPDNIQALIGGAVDMCLAIVTALIDNAPLLIDAAVEMAAQLAVALKDYDWLSVAKKIYASIKDSIKGFITNITGGGSDEEASHAGGLDVVPYNGYRAELHQNEKVLTAAEAENYRKNTDYAELSAKVDALIANQNSGNTVVNISGSAGAIVRALNIEIEKENKRKSAFA